jgi:hypothetical protein
MQPKERQNGRAMDPETTAAVLGAIRFIRYGSVEIVIHDGRVVAIERREKVRLDKELGR